MTPSTCLTKRRARYAWLLRGGIGLALLVMAMSMHDSLVAIPALLAALIAFRGCPMCWALGLFEKEAP